MIVRFEPWGAWVKLESTAAIVALDREGVLALGLDGGAAWADASGASPPMEVHLAVTSRCAAGCSGCYLDATPDGLEPPRAEMLSALDALRDAGVLTVAFGGGEPPPARTWESWPRRPARAGSRRCSPPAGSASERRRSSASAPLRR